MRLPVLLLLAIALAPPPSLAQELTGADYYRLLQRADSLQRAADLPGLEPVVRRPWLKGGLGALAAAGLLLVKFGA